VNNMISEKISREDAFILWLMSLGINSASGILAEGNFTSAEDVFRKPYDLRGIVPRDTIDKIAEYANKGYIEKLIRSVSASMDTCADMRFISYKNKDFPMRLSQIPESPLGIFVRGALPSPNLPAVAIVGTRNNTNYGGKTAEDLAKQLAEVGVVIISGMALGLDARAHEGALKGQGDTVAVLPSGADVCYPSQNHYIFKQILESGCIVSEFLPGTIPQKWEFLSRNRIVSGFADILIVVEASARSGTSSTVNHALNQGKDVFAVPGRITDKMSAGTNEFIKQGAHICTSYLDILLYLKNKSHLAAFFDAVNKEITEDIVPQKLSLASDEALVYACMCHDPVTIDYIAYKTGLNLAKLNTILLEMELNGHIKKTAGKYNRS